MLKFLSWTWLGLILGVSFLATPAKFQAETLTLPVALEVGRVTFRLLDRLEWLLLVAVLVAAWRHRPSLGQDRGALAAAAVLAAVTAVQSLYFLPALDARVALVMAGEPLPESSLHAVSGGLEVVQALTLLILGIRARP
ncbi:MAG: hypothetical protein AAF725_16820 [Acidobacteriota bacterium]